MKQIAALLLAFIGAIGYGQSTKNQEFAVFTVSGTSFTFQDSTGSGTITLEELISGGPSTVSIITQGCLRGGTCTTLDTNTNTSSSLRPQFTGGYDSYKVTASWTGGTNVTVTVNKVGIQAKVLSSGGGSNATTVNGASVPASQTCVGSNASSQLIAGTCSAGGSGTVNSGTAGQLATYSTNGTAVSGTNALPSGTTATTGSAGNTVATNTDVAAAQAASQPIFGSQTANYFYAAPNGTAGMPGFRAILAADVPTLNQNTTGTAANVTATSNATLTTLSALALPLSQTTGTLPTAQTAALTGDVTKAAGSNSTTLAATTNSTLTTLSALSLPNTQVTGLGTASTQNTGTSGANLGFLNGTNNYSGQSTYSFSPGASGSAILATGTPFAGTATTSTPLIYANTIGATARTTFATGGTYFGVNAASGFAGNFFDFGINGGSSLLALTSTGVLQTQLITASNGSGNFQTGTSTAFSNTTTSANQFAGSTNVGFRVLIASGNATGGGSVSGSNILGLEVPSAPITTFTSGTHPWIANAVVNTLGTITSGGAGATNTASLYVGSPSAFGTYNYSIFSAGPTNSATYGTNTNCSSSASPAVCGSAAAGSVVIAATATAVTVNTTAVTANSQILITPDESLGTKLGVTCNTTAASALAGYGITARVAGTSFTLTTTGTIATNPTCYSYSIWN